MTIETKSLKERFKDIFFMIVIGGLGIVLVIGVITLLSNIRPSWDRFDSATEALTYEIEQQAIYDLSQSRPAASVSDLDILFGERADELDIPVKDVTRIYTSQYNSNPAPYFCASVMLVLFFVVSIKNKGWKIAG